MSDEAYSPSHPTEQDMDIETEEDDDNLDLMVNKVTEELREKKLPKSSSSNSVNSPEALDRSLPTVPVPPPTSSSSPEEIFIPFKANQDSNDQHQDGQLNTSSNNQDIESIHIKQELIYSNETKSPNHLSHPDEKQKHSPSRSQSQSSSGKTKKENVRECRHSPSSHYGNSRNSPKGSQTNRKSFQRAESPHWDNSRRRSRSPSKENNLHSLNNRQSSGRKSRFRSRSPPSQVSNFSFHSNDVNNRDHHSNHFPQHPNSRWNGRYDGHHDSLSRTSSQMSQNFNPNFSNVPTNFSSFPPPQNQMMPNQFISPFSQPHHPPRPFASANFVNVANSNQLIVPMAPPHLGNSLPGIPDSQPFLPPLINSITNPLPQGPNQFFNPHQQIIDLIKQQPPRPPPLPSNSKNLLQLTPTPINHPPPPPPPEEVDKLPPPPSAVDTIMQRLNQMRQNVETERSTSIFPSAPPPPPPPPPPTSQVPALPTPSNDAGGLSSLNELVNSAAAKLFHQLKGTQNQASPALPISGSQKMFVPPPLPDYKKATSQSTSAASNSSPKRGRNIDHSYGFHDDDRFSVANFPNRAESVISSGAIQSKYKSKKESKKQSVSTAFLESTHRSDFSSKQEWLERIAYEMKQALRPHYMAKQINKSQYKMILKKGVTKIAKSNVENINKEKIAKFTNTYVEKYARNSPD